ncbi:MAG: hypothetical protein WDN08_13245 [Rhizomicrobium sp.]
MRFAFFLGLGLLLAASAARAENWVHTRDGGAGLPMCFDKDSVKVGADNLTHYAVKMCQDSAPQWYAVDCAKNFKIELLVRIYDRLDPTRYREMTVNNPDSGLAIDAQMACNK